MTEKCHKKFVWIKRNIFEKICPRLLKMCSEIKECFIGSWGWTPLHTLIYSHPECRFVQSSCYIVSHRVGFEPTSVPFS